MDANYEYSQSNLLNAIRKPQNAKIKEKFEKMQQRMQKGGMPKPQEMADPTAEKSEKNNPDLDNNNELKNAFKTVNFQIEIKTIEGYLEMLKNCDSDEINKFIKNNKTNQEKMVINENAESIYKPK